MWNRINDNKYVPHHPNEAMPERVRQLWKYFTETLEWGSTHHHSKATFDFIVDAMNFCAGRAILDAGAGHQRFKPFFEQSIYLTQEHPSGIEFKAMQNLHYDFVRSMDERIPLKSGSLACIYNHSVLEHVRYPQAFLNEAYRVLSPGGRLYVHVPFSYAEHEVPYDFQRPTRYGLTRWLEDAGFSRVLVIPSSNQTYGVLHGALMAAHQDCSARGKLSEFNALLPIFRYCIDYMNAVADDYIDIAATQPVGWLAIAGKSGELPDQMAMTKSDFLSEFAECPV